MSPRTTSAWYLEDQCHVYLGVFIDPGSPNAYLKAGVSVDPVFRSQQFNTHLPGGLTSMRSILFDSKRQALIAETALLQGLIALPGAEMAGGEWVRIPVSRLSQAVALFKLPNKTVLDVPIRPAKPKRAPKDRVHVSETANERRGRLDRTQAELRAAHENRSRG